MANPDAPFGMRFARTLDGSPPATRRAYISASYATALYIGDPVLWTATLAEKDATAKYPTINRSAGTTGTLIRGVINSFEHLPNNLTLQYNPASTARWCEITVATPMAVFHIRDDGDATPAAVWVGQNAVGAYTDAGSTITGLSGFAIDGTTAPTTTQAFPIHILGLADIEDNELGDFAIWEVIANTCYNTTGLYLGVTAA